MSNLMASSPFYGNFRDADTGKTPSMTERGYQPDKTGQTNQPNRSHPAGQPDGKFTAMAGEPTRLSPSSDKTIREQPGRAFPAHRISSF